MESSDAIVETSREEGTSGDAHVGASPMVLVRGVQNWFVIWVPLAASLLSLILAVVSLVVATHDPGVVVILPSRVIMDDADFGADTPFHPANIYLQPNFVGTGNNNRIELLSRLSLTIMPDSGGSSTLAEWTEQGTWDFIDGVVDSAGGTSSTRSYIYSADAAPLLISPNNAQQPLCVFPLPHGFELKPDVRYRLTLTADRVVAGTPLNVVGHLQITQSDIDFYKSTTSHCSTLTRKWSR